MEDFSRRVMRGLNRRCKVIDDDSYVVHPFKRHVSNLQSGVYSDDGPFRFLLFLHVVHLSDLGRRACDPSLHLRSTQVFVLNKADGTIRVATK